MTATGDFCRTGDLETSSVMSDETWMPQDVKRALNLEHMPVIYYEESTRPEILSDCKHSRQIGLTYIRLTLDDIFMICLALEDRIYVLDLKHADQLQLFLKLAKHDVKFYAIRGDLANYRLMELASIKLTNLVDLTAYDIFLSMRKSSLTGLKTMSEEYTASVMDERGLPYRNKHDLAKFWLGISLPKKEKCDEIEENKAIRDTPLSVAARNVIRSRSCLNRELALRMMEDFEKMTTWDTKKLYSFALDINNEDYTYMMSQICPGDAELIPYSLIMTSLNRCTKQ